MFRFLFNKETADSDSEDEVERKAQDLKEWKADLINNDGTLDHDFSTDAPKSKRKKKSATKGKSAAEIEAEASWDAAIECEAGGSQSDDKKKQKKEKKKQKKEKKSTSALEDELEDEVEQKETEKVKEESNEDEGVSEQKKQKKKKKKKNQQKEEEDGEFAKPAAESPSTGTPNSANGTTEKIKKRKRVTECNEDEVVDKETQESAEADTKEKEVSKKEKKKKTANKASGQDDEKEKGTAKTGAKQGNTPSDPNVEQSSKKKQRWRDRHSVFVGQLPYSATEGMIESHFRKSGVEGRIAVRVLTDKNTKKSRGIAYVDVESPEHVEMCLSLHHSLLTGRRINVEMTSAGGGTNSDRRKQEIAQHKKDAEDQAKKKVQTMIDEFVEGGHVEATDIDDHNQEFLMQVPFEVAKAALTEFSELDFDGVRNRCAYLMGLIKRHLEWTDTTVEKEEEWW